MVLVLGSCLFISACNLDEVVDFSELDWKQPSPVKYINALI